MNYLLAIAAVAILLIFGIAFMNQSYADRVQAEARAESMIIRAQAESRLTSAQAGAITMAAGSPRREVWQALSNHQPDMVLPGKFEVRK